MVPVYKIIRVYEYLFQRKYANPNFSLYRTKRNLRLLASFQKIIPINSGDNFIWNYSVYAFWCYEGMLSSRRIELNWIYSEKMYQRYLNRTEEQLYYLQQYKESKGISNPLREKYSLTLSPRYKDNQRRLYWNTMMGFIHCSEFSGVLYDPSNALCKHCRYKNKCNVQED